MPPSPLPTSRLEDALLVWLCTIHHDVMDPPLLLAVWARVRTLTPLTLPLTPPSIPAPKPHSGCLLWLATSKRSYPTSVISCCPCCCVVQMHGCDTPSCIASRAMRCDHQQYHSGNPQHHCRAALQPFSRRAQRGAEQAITPPHWRTSRTRGRNCAKIQSENVFKPFPSCARPWHAHSSTLKPCPGSEWSRCAPPSSIVEQRAQRAQATRLPR